MTYYLPELLYYRIGEFRDLSGRAIRFMLTAAIDRVIDARANAEDALIRADQMALTLGKNTGLFNLSGDYESGAFNHAIEEREIIPITGLEAAQAELAEAQAKIAKQQVTDPVFLKEMGYTPEEVQQILTGQQVTQAQAGGAMLNAMERGQGSANVQTATPGSALIRQMLDRMNNLGQ